MIYDDYPEPPDVDPYDLDDLGEHAVNIGSPVSGDTSVSGDTHESGAGRSLTLTSAATIRPRPVFWLWEDRIALGTLSLLAGREGLGKSTLGYALAARVTRGELRGEYLTTPRSVIVAATEDSWEHTIVPRLIAAGADLERVYRVDVVTDMGIHVGLSLPRDLLDLERNAVQVGAALLLLDPLMSRLGSLDTHRDAEVRQALEPLVALADRARMSVLGLIHHNKSGSADPLQLVMGSKAFTAVARSVHTVVPDPEDESERRRLFGTPKNNLGRTDLATLSFTIVSHPIETDEGTAWTGRLEWGSESAVTIGDAMRLSTDSDSADDASEAAAWLSDYLTSKAGRAKSSEVKKAATAEGIRTRALTAARKRLRLLTPSEGFPRVTWWELPALEAPSGYSRDAPSRGDVTTVLTVTTGRSRDSGDSGDSRDGPHASASPLDEEVRCTGCSRRLGRAEADAGVCLPCSRIAAAEDRAAGDQS